jgi:hypothetical protein
LGNPLLHTTYYSDLYATVDHMVQPSLRISENSPFETA